jgi:MerR family mercuric resistance operon transcriptional regulator
MALGQRRRPFKDAMTEQGLLIGQVAAEAGVNIRTLRFYEREGVLPPPERRPSGYRTYSPETVSLVRFIKRAQALGYTLAEAKELLALRDTRGAACAEVQRNAGQKLADVRERIRQLQAMALALSKLLSSCAEPHHAHACPLLEALDAPPSPPARRQPRMPRTSSTHSP